jgi:predicted AlkP superfamily phosphohydrolase/phosphomutase
VTEHCVRLLGHVALYLDAVRIDEGEVEIRHAGAAGRDEAVAVPVHEHDEIAAPLARGQFSAPASSELRESRVQGRQRDLQQGTTHSVLEIWVELRRREIPCCQARDRGLALDLTFVAGAADNTDQQPCVAQEAHAPLVHHVRRTDTGLRLTTSCPANTLPTMKTALPGHLRLILGLVVAGCGGTSRRAPDDTASTRATPTGTAAPAQPAQPKGRLLMLGFDGVDPRWLEQWAAQGKLPTLKKLMDANGGKSYRRLASTNPPQSPVAWTSFATGTPPGEHGIFDFIARGLSHAPGPLPIVLSVATTSFEVQPAGPPVARNLRSGAPFWQTLGNDGVRVVALNVPYSFPPDPMREGRMLSGLGTPDVRETNSTFTYVATDVTDEQVKRPPGGGSMVKLLLTDGAGRFDLEGPSVPGGDGERIKLQVSVRVGVPKSGMTVEVAGTAVALRLGEWSEFQRLEWVHGGTRVKGVLRYLALEAGKRTRLFVSPISIDPREPYSAIAHPRGFSASIADELGHDYKTVGWDHDTSALNAEVVDDAAFLADVAAVERDRRQMLLDRMGKSDWDLLIWVSTSTDRVAHMFYRLMDPEHPRYDDALAKRFGDAIEREYVRMDATVAEVLSRLGAGDTLLILSDHGFHNFRRGLHVNQWLRQQGLLTLKDGASSSSRDFLIDTDWSKTKAYAVGTGQVYFNLVGRERDGVVQPAQVPALTKQIREGLVALRDTERKGSQVVKQVYAGADVFAGARSGAAPDMQIAFAENYRTSWETILGGVPKALFADNDKKWSGDHSASDVAETPGVLVSNRPIANEQPAIVDFAPTAHAFFGKPAASQYVGRPLLNAAQ